MITVRAMRRFDAAVERYHAAALEMDLARADMREAAREMAAEGASEMALAKAARVQRQTVRHWLGKGSHATPGQ
jgi:transposase-like protein